MDQKRVLFYSSVKNKHSFKAVQFYSIDISLLEELGYKVVLSNKIYDAWLFWKYDFVFAYFYRYSFFVALIARIFGRKSYFTGGIDDLDKNYRGSRGYKVQSFFFKLCYMISERVIIVSQADLNNVKSVLSDSRKIAYSEHTININRYKNSNINKKNVFVTIGWMAKSSIARKGIDRALKVFGALVKHPEFSDYSFELVGTPGDGVSYLESLINELNISERVVIRGNISEEEKIDLLEQSKYYFQLSSYEGFGLAALEAVCAKNILIHSGRGGLSNPIYSKEVLFNIDTDFEIEVSKLYETLVSFDTNRIEETYNLIVRNYGNERRKKDFAAIISV